MIIISLKCLFIGSLDAVPCLSTSHPHIPNPKPTNWCENDSVKRLSDYLSQVPMHEGKNSDEGKCKLWNIIDMFSIHEHHSYQNDYSKGTPAVHGPFMLLSSITYRIWVKSPLKAIGCTPFRPCRLYWHTKTMFGLQPSITFITFPPKSPNYDGQSKTSTS